MWCPGSCQDNLLQQETKMGAAQLMKLHLIISIRPTKKQKRNQ
uniref:Uncharacterized protein n=1 Tax=Arundo donax TaxID=35708 RepID=A0A0A9AUD1_ARUDO